MTSTARAYSGLAATRTGQSKQVDKAFKGMADELKRRKAVQAADCDQPQTLEQAQRVIASLQNQLADAQRLIEDMRAQANSDAPVATVSSTKYWSTERMAKESGVAICTICRNADALNGIMVGGVWLFPAGIKYGKKRNRK